MRCTLYNLIFFCGACALVLGFTAPAEAGFMSLTDVSEFDGAAAMSSEGAGSSVPIQQPPTTPPPGIERQFEQFALLGPVPVGGSSSSMGSGGSSGPSSTVPCVISEPAVCSPAMVTGELTGEPRVNLPAPLLDAVFRPPRGR